MATCVTEGLTYVYTVWKVFSFECIFCNSCWVPAATTRINDKTGHMSDIKLVCNQFKEVKITVGPTDVYWTGFIRYENGTSTSVELSIRGDYERFPTKVFDDEHSFSLRF